MSKSQAEVGLRPKRLFLDVHYLVDLDDRAAAQAFIESDPFYEAGLFQRVEIVRWRKAYLAGRNTL